MRGRLILLALVGAASATAVVAAVMTTIPRPAQTVQASAIEETAAHLPGVSLDDEEATVKRFLGYENAPTPAPVVPPAAPWVPRSGGSDRGSAVVPDSGTPAPSTPDPSPSPSTPVPSPDPTSPDPTPSPTPSPDPTGGGDGDGDGATSPSPGDSETAPPGRAPLWPSSPVEGSADDDASIHSSE